MDLEYFKRQFEEAVAAMSDQDLIEAFAEMGCEVEIAPQSSDWEVFPACENGEAHAVCCLPSLRTTREAAGFAGPSDGSGDSLGSADSNELARAA